MGREKLTFRFRFYPVWRSHTSWATAIAGGLLFVFSLATGKPISPLGFTGSALIAVGCGLGLTIPVLMMRLTVSNQGIRSFDMLGRWHWVEWSAIEEVWPRRFVGLDYLVVRAEGLPRPIWIPLVLVDMPKFREAVTREAGPENPLTRALPKEACRTKRCT